MDFATAKSSFLSIVNSLSDDSKSDFLSWCKEYFSSEATSSKAYFDLRTIAEDIKTMVPQEAILPSEKVDNSQIDDESPVVHIDSFLFEEDHIDALVEEGKLSRNFCKTCGSLDCAPITFISHSMSVKRTEFIFKHMLPNLDGKVVLDVGSRLGAVLYGAYYCSSASKIIGVEINQDLCQLQNHIIDKYGLSDRIQVVCNEICNVPEILQAADVIIFNNVFQCFMDKGSQRNTWKWLENNIRKSGTVLVTVPSIEESIDTLETGVNLSTWVRKINIEEIGDIFMDDKDILDEMFLYVVL